MKILKCFFIYIYAETVICQSNYVEMATPRCPRSIMTNSNLL